MHTPHTQISSCEDMHHICQISKLVHVWIYFIYTYSNHNVTWNTGIHLFYIIDICPWTNMPVTLHIYVPLHVYCSPHIEPALVHISQKQHQTANFLYHAICTIGANNRYASQIPYISHIWELLHMQIWGYYVIKCLIWTLCNQQCD